MNIIGLHGFLGAGSDYTELSKSLSVEIHTPELLKKDPLGPENSFSRWSENFHELVSSLSGPKVLLAYSMGGRLALEYLLRHKSAFDWIYLLSTNVFTVENKEARLLWDSQWAERFKSEPWEDVLLQWNELLVFSGSKKAIRTEKEFDRQCLAQALVKWSPAHHEYDLLQIVERENLHFVVGEQDKKYAPLYLKSQLQKMGLVHFIKDSGHRVLQDQPQQLAELLKQTTFVDAMR